jgi:hypothetical protein
MARLTDKDATSRSVNEFSQQTNGISGGTLPSGNMPKTSFARTFSAKLHEDTHHMFGRIEAKYGTASRRKAAEYLFNAIQPLGYRQMVTDHLINSGYSPFSPHFKEEHVTHIISYLNNPDYRRRTHESMGIHNGTEAQKQAIDGMAKKSYAGIAGASKSLTPEHIGSGTAMTPKKESTLSKSVLGGCPFCKKEEHVGSC